jgi:hypothetical protein
MSAPPGYIVTEDGKLQAQLNAERARVQGVDLRNVQLISVGGKTGYYSGGAFVPLYGNALEDVTVAGATIRDFGSVDVAMPVMATTGGTDAGSQTNDTSARARTPSMSTARALSIDEYKEADTSSFDWSAASANASALADSANVPSPGVSDSTYANFGSASGGDNASAIRGAASRAGTGIPRVFDYGELDRGSRNIPGIALPDSMSHYPVFDLNPSPTVPPQLKSIAAAVSLQPNTRIVLPAGAYN